MNLQEKSQRHLVNTYHQYPLTVVRGEGSFIWDDHGKKYLDFYGGHAVCLLGHCPPAVVKAIRRQSEKLIFYSNIFKTEPAILLADKLAQTLEPETYQVYFTNSGSEANETALKIARKHTGKKCAISFEHAFHGRGVSSLAVTGISSYHKYDPNLDAFTAFARLGNISSVKAAWTEDTAAVICEPIQSIGGINMAEPVFYRELAEFCKDKGMALIFDEIQTGLGRTGTFWFSRSIGLSPDIITVAKGLAGGLPLSAVLVKDTFSKNIKTGDHATTFGGGPVPCAAGLAIMEMLTKRGFLETVVEKEKAIRDILGKNPAVAAIRGKGLLLGIEFVSPHPNLVEECLAQGLVIATSSEKNIFRIMPPLTVNMNEIQLFGEIFARVIHS